MPPHDSKSDGRINFCLATYAEMMRMTPMDREKLTHVAIEAMQQ